MRRLLIAGAAVAATLASLAIAPDARADAACAWVDPNGLCVSNPGIPRVPSVPRP